MDSSDSLKIDENLARFLAAYDQSIEGGDEDAVTVNVPLVELPPLPGERSVTPMRGEDVNEGSLGEVLPDPDRHTRIRRTLVGSGTVGGPHRIGRFELRRQLGKGGCGIVFLAYDPKLQREVALKIPRPEMVLNTDSKSRLKREALAAAEFDHPNLVPVFEYGEIGPLCYIATAFCPGQTLAEWLDRQAFPVPVRHAARLVAAVAEAVQHAHDRGVLHRDLKPNNVILQELRLEENDEPPPGSVLLRGDDFVPRLVDFGLAKLAERGGPSETGTRQILGTPKYMAPEQAQARREDIGPPADVYALGVILYEMLAGRAPYDGASDVEVLRQAVEGKPVTPRSLRPDIPRDLEAICLKAMARNTVERYRTAIDLADDLRRFLDGLPTIARPLAWPARAGRWLRRNDELVAIAVLAITVIFVTALGTWNWYDSRKLREEHNSALSERASRSRAEQERDYARQMHDAFLAWRGGNDAVAVETLGNARQIAEALKEVPDFTHDYLRRQLKSPQLVVVCPAGPVTALAISGNGTRLASGHADGSVTVWDRATGRQLGTIAAHASVVTHVAFALGDTRLFSVSTGERGATEASGWAVSPAGTLTPAPGAHRSLGRGVTCIAVAPGGRVVYAGTTTGKLLKLHLTNPSEGRESNISGGGVVTAVAVSPGGETVFTAEHAGRIRRWSADLTPTRFESRAPDRITALAALDATRAVAGCVGGQSLILKTVGTNEEYATGTQVNWLVAGPNGTLVQNGTDGRFIVNRRTEFASGDTGAIRAGAISPDGGTLYTAGEDGLIRSWALARDRRERGTLQVGRVASISVAKDGASFVVAADRTLTRFAGDVESRLTPGTPQPFAVVRVRDGGIVRAVTLEADAARVRDFTGTTAAEVAWLRVSRGQSATSAALATDGIWAAVGDSSGRVCVYVLGEARPRATIDTAGVPVRRLHFSPDGRYLAAPTPEGVGVWLASTGEQLAKLEADDRAVFTFLSQERLAIAGRDGVVRVRTFSGREDLTLLGHVGRITGLGVSPDGRTLVSGGATGEVKFWDSSTGTELLGLRRHSRPVTVVEFAASGKVLVTGGDGQLAVWDARE